MRVRDVSSLNRIGSLQEPSSRRSDARGVVDGRTRHNVDASLRDRVHGALDALRLLPQHLLSHLHHLQGMNETENNFWAQFA